ncbi:dihydrolipoamide acetyltransferase family protein [Oceanobacillus sojae]|uniref:dihydrolipoamide acetyltransferase family protein n=1 Tax=Oceanobacillus sojae TaxID=582851 RepID=UPI0009888503|nr:dihydrolipoamide acetyltransferase family protein [Oceanobacillus sojae]
MSVEKMTMPQLGESVTEGTVSTWLISVGDQVNKYDPIAEVMTDKVNAEVPSSYTGTITELVVEEGETVEIGALICYIETDQAAASGDSEAAGEKEPDMEDDKVKNEAANKDSSMKKRYSPAVLRLSQEHNVDLTKIDGTGKGGRITRKDVEKFIGNKDASQEQVKPSQEKKAGTSPAKETPSVPRGSIQTSAGDIEIPVKGVRKVIADNMVRSKQEIPHAWMQIEVDVTDLVKYRNSVKESFKNQEGFSLTPFAFFVKAVAQGLKEYPELNSMWAGDKIIQKKDVHLSIAVAKDKELFVPVIKHADEKTVKAIARDITTLAAKARQGKLSAEDMQGGTFTVNNTGSFGSVSSMGVINSPQAAILQVESIVKRPVIIEDMFAARDMVNLSLSLDHRILDGLVCGRFLSRVKEILEGMNESSITLY